MKNIYLTFYALVLTAAGAVAQNLVPNPGFEVQDTCPAVSEIFKAPPWESASIGTPDLFNSTCSTQNSPGRTGIGSAGVYAYSTFPDNREYMIAPLTAPLTAGTTYYVSFWVLRTNFRYAINRFGAYFSNGDINQQTTSVFNYTPQVQNPSTTVLSSTSSWMQITGSFVAAGGEDHIVLGNFSNDAATDTTVANSSSNSKVAYYKVDDIYVSASGTGIHDNMTDADVNVYPSLASSTVTVQMDGSVSVNGIRLFDMAGREVKGLEMGVPQAGEYVLNVSQLSPGAYFLAIEAGNTVIKKKVIVAR